MPVNAPLPKKDEVPKDELKAKNPENRIINNITFFGDSAIPEGDEIYNSVYEAAKILAENKYTIVDGGGPGIMKAATDGAESVKGDTVAVYWEPKLASFFEGKNLANITDEHSASSNYVMRTLGLIEKGDIYVVCKGGTGTISEFGLVWCLAKLYYGCHKPVILYGDFWEDLIEAFQRNMYIDEKELGVLYYAKTPQKLLEIIQMHETKISYCALKSFDGDEKAFLLTSRTRKTVESYNQHASSYHSVHAGKLVSQEQLDEFIKLVNPPAKVLDLGCGVGLDTKYLAEHYSVTGIEISKRFVQIAQFENPNVDIVLADIVKHDLGKNSYKGIWARDVLHHIEEKNLDIVFKKIADALVEHGVLYVIVREGEGEIVEKEKKNYGKLERFYHLFTADELQKRAEKAGLKLEKIDTIQRSHKWLSAIFRK